MLLVGRSSRAATASSMSTAGGSGRWSETITQALQSRRRTRPRTGRGCWARISQRPTFVIGQHQAMSRRLKRNYIWMFLLLLLAWGLKISTGSAQAIGPRAAFGPTWLPSWSAGADIGHIPGYAVIFVVVVFYGWLLHADLHPLSRAHRSGGRRGACVNCFAPAVPWLSPGAFHSRRSVSLRRSSTSAA